MNELRKPVSESYVNVSQIVFPTDANSVGTVFGGRILHWMDMAASLCARRHSRQRVATVAVNQVKFVKPVHVGDVVNIKAAVNRVFKVSMEVGVKIFIENTNSGKIMHACSGYFYMVSLDVNDRPVRTFEVIAQTDEEKRRWENAGNRYELNKKNKNF